MRALACTHKVVFCTQVTPLNVEMGVLRLSHRCLSRAIEEMVLHRKPLVANIVIRARLTLQPTFTGVCV